MKNTMKIFAVVMAVMMLALCFTACGQTGSTKAKVIEFKLTEEEYGIAFRLDDKDLQEKVNKAIKELKEDGTLDKLAEKYGVTLAL
jgi:ABC-type amino acid transport substrate-binding protein